MSKNDRFDLHTGKYLLLTNTVSCGLMMAAGDMMQQHSDFLKKHMTKSIDKKAITTETSSPVLREEATFSKAIALLDDELADLQDVVQIVSKTEVDVDKEGLDYVRIRNMTAVGLLQGPFHHYFYAALEKYLPGRATSAIVKKTVLDQTIASPTCLGIFFFGLGVMEHKNLQDINGEVKLKLFDTWKVE